MDKQEIFDLCDENKYLFVEAYSVEILKSELGENEFFINSIGGYTIKMGVCEESEMFAELMNNIEINSNDIDGEGFYTLKCLLSISYDSDDYRSWIVLEQEIIEFIYDYSHEDEKRWESQLPPDDGLSWDDLFKVS